MTPAKDPHSLDRLIDECRARRRAGADEASLVAWLHTRKLPLFKAVRVLMGAFGWSAGEPAHRIHSNPAWADSRALWGSLREALEAIEAASAEDAASGDGKAPED